MKKKIKIKFFDNYQGLLFSKYRMNYNLSLIKFEFRSKQNIYFMNNGGGKRLSLKSNSSEHNNRSAYEHVNDI